MPLPDEIRSFIATIDLPPRRVVAVETALCACILAVPWLIPVPPSVLPLFLVACLANWLRGRSWRSLGLRKPGSWVSTIAVAAVLAVGAYAASAWAVLPVLVRFLGPSDQSGSLSFLRGNVLGLAASLLVAWVMAAIPEEMVYRGYLFDRISDLLGRKTGGTIAAVIASSVVFALGHGPHSATFLALALLSGLIQGGAYVAWKGNLWMPILIHGIGNSISLVLVFAKVL